jgi:hypothetical protein
MDIGHFDFCRMFELFVPFEAHSTAQRKLNGGGAEGNVVFKDARIEKCLATPQSFNMIQT